MSDFVAFFPSKECVRPPASFSNLGRIFRGPLRADNVQIEALHGAAILCTRSEGRVPRFYAREDGAGWIVVKGQIFDVRSETPAVDLKDLLHIFLEEDMVGLNRYEGAFALAAWDARKRQGWTVNDQVSMLNLYYGEYDTGLYVSTNATSLARALGLGLDPCGVQELLARDVLLAPTTMFAGLRRVNIGEHVRYREGVLSHGKHWHGYEPEVGYRNVREAAEAAVAVAVDRIARYATSAGPVISDLTGGLDSRLLISAAHAADVEPAVTVNGPPDSQDVWIAHQVADAMRWDMRYFDTQSLWPAELTPEVRRELLYRTNGELPFTEAYFHLLSRPQLAQDFNLHLSGSGGELLRYHPWSQEFFGIGQRRLANTERVLDYRFLTNVPPPSLFSQNWLPTFRAGLKSRIEAICREQPGTRTTQQLDAVHIWKLTSHSSLYTSAVYNWLPSVAPLLSAGLVKVAIAMPWKMRLTSQLERQMIYASSPRAAEIVTSYGATAKPTSLRDFHLTALQSAKRGAHLAKKLDRVLLRGAFTGRGSAGKGATRESFLTRQLRELLLPETMLSHALYSTEGLRRALGESNGKRQAPSFLINRLATVEELCRELDFEPDRDFLAPVPPSR
jgi:hypothetical protein